MKVPPVDCRLHNGKQKIMKFKLTDQQKMKIVDAVRMHSLLYDCDSELYASHNKRDEAWTQIAKQVGLPVHDCKKAWKNLVDTLRRYRHRIADSVGPVDCRWRFYPALEFVLPYLGFKDASKQLERGEVLCSSDAGREAFLEENLSEISSNEQNNSFADNIHSSTSTSNHFDQLSSIWQQQVSGTVNAAGFVTGFVINNGNADCSNVFTNNGHSSASISIPSKRFKPDISGCNRLETAFNSHDNISYANNNPQSAAIKHEASTLDNESYNNNSSNNNAAMTNVEVCDTHELFTKAVVAELRKLPEDICDQVKSQIWSAVFTGKEEHRKCKAEHTIAAAVQDPGPLFLSTGVVNSREDMSTRAAIPK